MLDAKYQFKISGLRAAIACFSISECDLLSRYQGSVFKDSRIGKSDLFARILGACPTTEDANFIEEKCGHLSHFRDSRSGFDYGVDLILGWLLEDAVLLALADRGAKVRLDGADQTREFLCRQNISAWPDLRALNPLGAEVTIEILADWRDTWNRKDHLDLRDNKFVELLRKNAILFGVAPISGKGFAVRIKQFEDHFKQSFVPAYRKTGYTMKEVGSILCPLSSAMNKLVSEISHG